MPLAKDHKNALSEALPSSGMASTILSDCAEHLSYLITARIARLGHVCAGTNAQQQHKAMRWKAGLQIYTARGKWRSTVLGMAPEMFEKNVRGPPQMR